MDARNVLRSPVISEKSYALIAENKYTFRVHPDAHKTAIRSAVEEIFDVRVIDVRTMKMKSKPKRRGWTVGPHAAMEEGHRGACARRPHRAVRGGGARPSSAWRSASTSPRSRAVVSPPGWSARS